MSFGANGANGCRTTFMAMVLACRAEIGKVPEGKVTGKITSKDSLRVRGGRR